MDWKIRYKYNHLFFTEKSKDDYYDLNTDFWIKLDDLRRANPDCQICIERNIEYRSIVGRYCEVLEIQCEQESILNKALLIYDQFYHFLPLDLKDGISEKNVQDTCFQKASKPSQE